MHRQLHQDVSANPNVFWYVDQSDDLIPRVPHERPMVVNMNDTQTCDFNSFPHQPATARENQATPLEATTATMSKRIEDMTPEERLQSMKEFAEEKKYVRPGEDGTIPRGPGAMQALVFGGPFVSNGNPEYHGTLPPPSYDTIVGGDKPDPAKEKKDGPVKRWLEKRHAKKEADGKAE